MIPLDLPFDPARFAALGKNEYVFLGVEAVNQNPVLAVVDSSGDLDHYIDAYTDFGTDDSIVGSAPQWMKKDTTRMRYRGALQLALSAAEFVHHRDSLLLMMPGSKAKVFTIESGGAIESTALHLPAGLEAESILPSDKDWAIRATDAAAKRLVLVKVDPSNGRVLETLGSPVLDAQTISCFRDGDFYGIHWAGRKGAKRYF